MKKILSVFTCMILGVVICHCKTREDKVIKVLAIGNSFSADAIEQNLWELGQADGVAFVIGNMFIGGCSLERHVKNSRSGIADYRYCKIDADGTKTFTKGFSLEKALCDESWDIISLQQSSPLSGFIDSYHPWLEELVEFVKARKSDSAKIVFHQTWAYKGDSKHSAFPDYSNDQILMYNAIVDAVKSIAQGDIQDVIPCGTAIQNARTSSLGDTLTRDGYHLNLYGCYTAACTWYETLSGKPVTGNNYSPDGITPEQKKIAQTAAHRAVKRPYKISKVGVRVKSSAATF